MSATRPSSKRRQNSSGELQFPGSRHASPTTAMGVCLWSLMVPSFWMTMLEKISGVGSTSPVALPQSRPSLQGC